MNKSNVHPSATFSTDVQSVISTFPPVPVDSAPGATGRLVVLVPTGIDYSLATRRIWELASASGAHIQLLSLYGDADQEPALRRRLIPMVTLLRDGNVAAELKLESGTNWVELVKRNSQAGDMIVCFAEQRAGLLHRPLSQILQSSLCEPVYILSVSASQHLSRPSWRSQILAWTGAIGIIMGFFILQIQITSLTQNWSQTTLLILSVLAETWLIGIWNSLFG